MRLEIKAPNIKIYNQLLQLISLYKEVKIFLTSEDYLFISTSEIPERLMAEIKSLGVKVKQEYQYDIDTKPNEDAKKILQDLLADIKAMPEAKDRVEALMLINMGLAGYKYNPDLSMDENLKKFMIFNNRKLNEMSKIP